MKKLTKQEAITSFRKQWNWMADETERRQEKVLKEEYFKENKINEADIPSQSCYCCEYDDQYGEMCSKCPIDWNAPRSKRAPCVDSLYVKWEKTNSWLEAARLARKIANLPERVGEVE